MSYIDSLQQDIGLRFKNTALLKQALTHSSYAKQKIYHSIQDNERLEFLGDAVLKLLVSEYLYQKYPKADEGELTKLRAKFVSDHALGHLAKTIQLGAYMILSHGEAHTGGETKVSNLANAFEALLGACYLDQGLETAKAFFIPLLEQHFDLLFSEEDGQDYKTTLQEWTQKHRLSLPKYEVLREEGPDHEKIFYVEVQLMIQGKSRIFSGQGINKKMAQQSAAKAALSAILHPRSPS